MGKVSGSPEYVVSYLRILLRYKPVARDVGGKPNHHLFIIGEEVTFSGVNGKHDGFESYAVPNPLHDRFSIMNYCLQYPVLTFEDPSKRKT